MTSTLINVDYTVVYIMTEIFFATFNDNFSIK